MTVLVSSNKGATGAGVRYVAFCLDSVSNEEFIIDACDLFLCLSGVGVNGPMVLILISDLGGEGVRGSKLRLPFPTWAGVMILVSSNGSTGAGVRNVASFSLCGVGDFGVIVLVSLFSLQGDGVAGSIVFVPANWLGGAAGTMNCLDTTFLSGVGVTGPITTVSFTCFFGDGVWAGGATLIT